MKLSIIIPTYNSANVLRRAIESILGQTFTDYEILIIDKVSKDGTVDIARSYGDPRIRVYSGSDNGIYDAMNKGIANARGEWLYFLGSDDWLLNENVLKTIFAIEGLDDYDVAYGDVEASHLSKRYHGEWRIENIDFNRCHQAILYKHRLLVKFGGYSLKYPLLADYDLNLKWFLSRKYRSLFIDNLQIAHFSDKGCSARKTDDAFLRDKDLLILKKGVTQLSRSQRKAHIYNMLQKHSFGRFMLNTYRKCILFICKLQHRRLQVVKKLHHIDQPVVHLYATCWNEEKMLPYLFSHYDSIVDRFFIYDNHSTDSSRKLIKANRKAELRVYAPKKIDDHALRDFKNNCWKKSRGKADLVIVCDVDEFLYHEEPAAFIRYFVKGGFTICHPQGYEMISTAFPEYTKGAMLTNLVRTGVECDSYSKCILFDPHRIVNINFQFGAHKCDPSGIIREYNGFDVKMLHYKKLGLDNVIARYESMGRRLSEKNIKSGMAIHYQWTRERIKKDFSALMGDCSEVIQPKSS